jgi:hypothetical protein
MGFNTIANAFGCLAIGMYNVGGGNPTNWCGSDAVFEVGNGSSPVSRSNAFSVNRDGMVSIGYKLVTPVINLPLTSSAEGQIRINDIRYFHAFGQDNLFIGQYAGNFSLSASNCLAIGRSAGGALTTGNHNTILGHYAGLDVSEGIGNILIGSETGISLQTGNSNTIIGYAAGTSLTTGSNNIFIGTTAGAFETGSNKLYIESSQADSANALIFGNFATNKLSVNGTLITKDSLFAANILTTGTFTLPNSTAAEGIIYRGSSPWLHNFGTGNVFLGKYAGNLTLSGSSYNTAIGDSTLSSITTGSYNVALGSGALKFITSGSENTAVGYAASCVADESNTVAIGYQATADKSNQVRLGNDGITSLYCMGAYLGTVNSNNVGLYADENGQIGYLPSSARYKDNITDLADVNWMYDLRPVNFTYKTDELDKIQYGLIAEEVEKVNPDFVHYNSDGQVETVSYNQLIAPMIKALQEQNNNIEELKGEIDVMKAEREQLMSRIEALEKEVKR